MWVKFKFKFVLNTIKKRYYYILLIRVHQEIQQSISSPLKGEDKGGGDPPPLYPLPPGEANWRLLNLV
jgi:hypothetical protein